MFCISVFPGSCSVCLKRNSDYTIRDFGVSVLKRHPAFIGFKSLLIMQVIIARQRQESLSCFSEWVSWISYCSDAAGRATVGSMWHICGRLNNVLVSVSN